MGSGATSPGKKVRATTPERPTFEVTSPGSGWTRPNLVPPRPTSSHSWERYARWGLGVGVRAVGKPLLRGLPALDDDLVPPRPDVSGPRRRECSEARDEVGFYLPCSDPYLVPRPNLVPPRPRRVPRPRPSSPPIERGTRYEGLDGRTMLRAQRTSEHTRRRLWWGPWGPLLGGPVSGLSPFTRWRARGAP